MSRFPDYVLRNRQAWNAMAAEYEEPGRRAWASAEPTWGIWGIPESQLRVLPDLAGKDVIELGCGTAYVSAWLARRGATSSASTTRRYNSRMPGVFKESSDFGSR